MTAVIQARGLGKRNRNRWALADCTLSIPAGHIAGLVGPTPAAADPGRAGRQPRPARSPGLPAGPDGSHRRAPDKGRAVLPPGRRPACSGERRWSPASWRPVRSVWPGTRASPAPAGWRSSSPRSAWPPWSPPGCSACSLPGGPARSTGPADSRVRGHADPLLAGGVRRAASSRSAMPRSRSS